jgi:hypothetical protein
VVPTSIYYPPFSCLPRVRVQMKIVLQSHLPFPCPMMALPGSNCGSARATLADPFFRPAPLRTASPRRAMPQNDLVYTWHAYQMSGGSAEPHHNGTCYWTSNRRPGSYWDRAILAPSVYSLHLDRRLSDS